MFNPVAAISLRALILWSALRRAIRLMISSATESMVSSNVLCYLSSLFIWPSGLSHDQGRLTVEGNRLVKAAYCRDDDLRFFLFRSGR